MTNTETAPNNRRLEFTPEVERVFQETYYARIRTTLRATFIILSGLSVLIAFLNIIFNGTFVYCLAVVANLLFLSSAYRREFLEHWQPLIVVTILVSLSIPFFSLAHVEDEQGYHILYIVPYAVILGLRVLRLQLRWMLLLLSGIVVIGVSAILSAPPVLWPAIFTFVFVYSFVMLLPVLLTLKHDRFERSEFLSKYQLTEERNTERRKREQTEHMLQVLSQAIGSIVHDLGNPLTAVQTGSETLLHFAREDDLDPALVQEFAEMITDGAQMLNYLRLSLMEETRVLEGKPIPIEPTTVSIRQIVETGARYQKPRFASGRNVCLKAEDQEVYVDRMKMVTVFMNLIGNALKYSDGAVHITWHTHKHQCLVAILDQGKSGRGISKAQAEQLFVAFGRLDTHTQVEGTGLGLLSVRKIVEAHGGEVYIEGYINGTPDSGTFNTAQGIYPSLLSGDLISSDGSIPVKDCRTAFVVVCQLDPQPHDLNGPSSADQVLKLPALQQEKGHSATVTV